MSRIWKVNLKTGKNDEGFEEMVKERSHGAAENCLDCRTKKRERDEERGKPIFVGVYRISWIWWL